MVPEGRTVPPKLERIAERIITVDLETETGRVRCHIFAEDLEMRMSEPHIIINGQPLTIAQAMTVRVAIGEFLLTLQDEDFLRDLGPIGPHYKERLIEIAKLMVRP